MRNRCLLLPCLALLTVGFFVACAPDPPIVSVSDAYVPYGATMVPAPSYAGANGQQPRLTRPVASLGSTTIPLEIPPEKSPSSLYREVQVSKNFLSYRARGRTRKSMNPRYITIHSTQNWSPGADANRHALALHRGALGRLSWHYTVDEDHAVQHLPTNEQGNHADYDGPGNRYSIGIEMCEHPGNSRAQTVDRTAKLAAWLMHRHNIPLSRVVPHYRWPRKGKNPENKNCPHFLLNNGRPGSKWRSFQKRVDSHYRKISSRASIYGRG